MENGGSKWQDGVSPWERRQKLRYEKQLQSAGIAAAGSRLLVVFYWTLKTEFCFILSGGNVCMFWGIRKSITCVYFYFYVYGEMSTYTCKLSLLDTPNQVCSINCIGPEADSDTEPTSEPEVQEEAAKTSVSGNPSGNLQEKNMMQKQLLLVRRMPCKLTQQHCRRRLKSRIDRHVVRWPHS